MKSHIHRYFIKPDPPFPNNNMLPVLFYEHALRIPYLFPAMRIKGLFESNGWTNNWKAGIYEYDHYHSNTHEAMAVIKGKTTLLLGGRRGKKLIISKGDVIIIPAGVAHCTLGKENDVVCIGGYPEGKAFDMNYGHPGERPDADHRIEALPIPDKDPVFGTVKGLINLWS